MKFKIATSLFSPVCLVHYPEHWISTTKTCIDGLRPLRVIDATHRGRLAKNTTNPSFSLFLRFFSLSFSLIVLILYLSSRSEERKNRKIPLSDSVHRYPLWSSAVKLDIAITGSVCIPKWKTIGINIGSQDVQSAAIGWGRRPRCGQQSEADSEGGGGRGTAEGAEYRDAFMINGVVLF